MGPTRPLGRHQREELADSLTDEMLLSAMAVQDLRAGGAFVRRHERRVYGIALAITADAALAEDVAQETFERAWRHAAVFDVRRGTALTWLSTIVRNLAVDALRLRHPTPIDPGASALVEQISRDRLPEEQVEHALEADRVRAALAGLPLEQRRALVLAAYYGQSASEISATEDIPLGTAKGRIRLGLEKVRDALHVGEE